MKHKLALVIGCLSFLYANGSPAHLEPAGFGPFEDSRSAIRHSKLADLFRLEDDVQGFRFIVICVYDDGRACAKFVGEDRNGFWVVTVRETLVSIDSAKPRDVVERQVKIDAELGKEMFTEVVSALREVAYNDASSEKVEKKFRPFDTGGVETFVFACPDRAFLAGRTWNPPEGSKPWKIQEMALKLGRSDPTHQP